MIGDEDAISQTCALPAMPSTAAPRRKEDLFGRRVLRRVVLPLQYLPDQSDVVEHARQFALVVEILGLVVAQVLANFRAAARNASASSDSPSRCAR